MGIFDGLTDEEESLLRGTGDSGQTEPESGAPGNRQETTEPVTLGSLGIGWVTQLRVLTTRPRAWIVGTLVAGLTVSEAYSRMQGGESAVELIVEQYFFAEVLRPAAVSLVESSLSLIDSLLILAFGTDYALGVSPGTTVGFADIPFAISGPVGDAVLAVGGQVTGGINTVNTSIGMEIAGAGIFGSAIANFLWASEIAVAVWLGWVVLNALDPGIVVPTLSAITRPVRNFIDLLT